ncbi:hypothetical protein BOTBODRAFT_83091, partial [Botryobasidium botryosum FD-172 SS1]
ELGEDDIHNIRVFNLLTKHSLSDHLYNDFPHTFPKHTFGSIYELQQHMARLSGVRPKFYDMCPNSCLCYVGPNRNLSKCPYCSEERWTSDRIVRKTYSYIPLKPRLVAMVGNTRLAGLMRYRGQYVHDPNCITDTFGGEHYQRLLKKRVTIGDRKLDHLFFSDARDIALGISTDGFCPFKRRSKT